MSRFPSGREAKEFLIARILEEAEREGVVLSDLERKMLYFSETGWAPPGALEVEEQFASQYNSDEYEDKIAKLIRQAHKRARANRQGAVWDDAVRTLRREDHYLVVMIDRVLPAGSPRHDGLRLFATALATIAALSLILSLGFRFGLPATRNSIMVTVVACIAGPYWLLRILLGRERAREIVGRFLGWIGFRWQ